MQKNTRALSAAVPRTERLIFAMMMTLLFALWAGKAGADTTIIAEPGSIETTVVTDPPTGTAVITETPRAGTTIVTTEPAPKATIVASPAEVIIERPDEPVTISITSDGGPITADDIRAARLLVDGQVYTSNVNLDVVDGKIVLQPIQNLAPGRYTLLLDTTLGEREVIVYNPTPNYPRTISSQAKILGVTEPELEITLGRRLDVPAKTMDLNLKLVYYQGQTIMADMDVEAGHQYAWRVNGKEVKYGSGDHTFVYTFKDPGTNVVTYTEKDGDRIMASGIQAVDIVSRPVIVRQYVAGTEVNLTGPAGYDDYTWKVNGETVATGQNFTHIFTAPGTHQVEVVAEDPKDTAADEYRAMTYEFAVKAQ